MEPSLRPSAGLILHILNLAVGLAIFVIASASAASVTASVERSIDGLGPAHITISDQHPQRQVAGQLTWRAYEILRASLGSQYVVGPVLQLFAPSTDGLEQQQTISVLVVEPQFFDIIRPTKILGDISLTSAGEVGTCVAGSNLTFRGRSPPIGSIIQIAGRACVVRGTVAFSQSMAVLPADSSLFLSFDQVGDLVTHTERPLSHLVLSSDGQMVESKVGGQLLQLLSREFDTSALQVRAPYELWEARRQIIQALGGLAIGVAGLIVVMAATSVSNGLLLHVSSRRGEIGLRIALGATRADVFRMIMKESLAIAIIGGGFGAIVGALVVTYVVGPMSADASLYAEEVFVTMDTTSIVMTLAVLFGAGCGASYFPARSAATTEPSIALRAL